MGLIYTDYFQKSKVFLYPLLGIGRKAKYVPLQTYVCWDSVYSVEDCRLILEYKTKQTKGFKDFAEKYLDNHDMYDDFVELSKDKVIYIFNLTKAFKPDHKRFINGKYSQLSLNAKILIIDFFGDKEKAGEYIQTFLTPDESFESYAQYFKVDKDLLESIGELCSKPDIEKETLVNNNAVLYQLLKKDSIHLTKQK
jgi:hypothetical protein|tara:strand:+ start:591 stop:1178 length:588 start_codon:yes stop_codon:yes gene_type:complete